MRSDPHPFGIFQVPLATFDGGTTRLVRLLDNSHAMWSEILQDAPKHAERTLADRWRAAMSSLKAGELVATFLLEKKFEGEWRPVNAAIIGNDNVHEPPEGNRVNLVVMDHASVAVTVPRMDPYVFWFLFELCGLDVDEDLFPRVTFDLEIPVPVPDDRLQAVRDSGVYQTLKRRISEWKYNPPAPKEQEHRINDIVSWSETVLKMLPGDATMYHYDVMSPMSAGASFTDAIEFALEWEGIEHYTGALFLFIEDEPSAPWWGFLAEGFEPRKKEEPRNVTLDESDLIDALIASRIFIPETQYEAWMDAHTARPTEVLADIDIEPFHLLSTRVPWLWSDDDLMIFLAKRRGDGF